MEWVISTEQLCKSFCGTTIVQEGNLVSLFIVFAQLFCNSLAFGIFFISEYLYPSVIDGALSTALIAETIQMLIGRKLEITAFHITMAGLTLIVAALLSSRLMYGVNRMEAE